MAQKIWLEAADFDDFGGWHLDSQYVHKMGSPYLLAPFFEGKPALDAKSSLRIPADGTYTLWVRARNWIKDHGPGRFTISLDNERTAAVFGCAQRNDWHWEKGGVFKLREGRCTVSLNDMTGYFSRFNALVLTDDASYTPPEDLDELRKERMAALNRPVEPLDGGEYDFIVVGGGPGGFPAALQAARMGLNTLIIHDRPVLGGNASPEMNVPFDGANSRQLHARETGICEEIFWMRRNSGADYNVIFHELAEPLNNLRIVLNQRVLAADTERGRLTVDRRITAVTARDVLAGTNHTYRGNLFLDGTGDGWLGTFAGADMMFGREAKSDFRETMAPDEADRMTMSGCLRGPFGPDWIIKRDRPISFETPEWVKLFGPEFESYRSIPGVSPFHWWLEHSNDLDDVENPEECRDELIKIYLSYWDYMKNRWSRKEESANYELNYVSFLNGRREGGRLIGDYVLCEEDCRTGNDFDDTIAYAGWPIDIHHPRGIYSGEEGPFFSNMDVPLVKVPYRCLYSRNVENLFMAGRNISVTHIALGTVRVEATCAIMGQAAGIAAALCAYHGKFPRGIYEDHVNELQQLCLKHDLFIPGVPNQCSADLALKASASSSSTDNWEIFPRDKGWPRGWPQLSDCKRALFFPLEAETKVDSLYVKLQNRSDAPRELILHIYESDAPGVFATNSPMGETTGIISGSSEAWVEFPVNRKFAMKYAWVYLDEADDVYIQRMVSGKLDTYLAWQHPWDDGWQIAPRHEYYAYRLEKPKIEYGAAGADQVNNGWNRAVDPEKYMWISRPNESFPQWVQLDWDKPQSFNSVYLTFDTDLNNPAMNGKSSTKSSPFCVSDYELLIRDEAKGTWKTIETVRNNFHRRRVHRFHRKISGAIRLKVNNAVGSYSARICEIRVYNEDLENHMPLNFTELMMPAKRHSVMKEKDHCVWGGTQVKHDDGKYYLIYSRWPKSAGHGGWVTCCELGWAKSDSPLGPWEMGGIALAGSGREGDWDRDCVHNPTMIPYEGKYYLYYMANFGNGEYWDHRNNQRIGVAVADHPAGPWKRSEAPVIDVTRGSHDHLMTSNPSVAIRPDGGILMVYKAVGDNNGLRPQGGPVVCGVAKAAHPLGPFRKYPDPVMVNPEHDWSVEDPYIWYQEDRYYGLVKDFQGYFANERFSVALFESFDGIDWKPSEHANGFDRRITWEDGEGEKFFSMERPQILLNEKGRPRVLLCATTQDEDGLETFNLQIPLKEV